MGYNHEAQGSEALSVPSVTVEEIPAIDFEGAYTALNNALLAALQLPDKDWNNQRRVRILLTPVVIPQVEVFIENKN